MNPYLAGGGGGGSQRDQLRPGPRACPSTHILISSCMRTMCHYVLAICSDSRRDFLASVACRWPMILGLLRRVLRLGTVAYRPWTGPRRHFGVVRGVLLRSAVSRRGRGPPCPGPGTVSEHPLPFPFSLPPSDDHMSRTGDPGSMRSDAFVVYSAIMMVQAPVILLASNTVTAVNQVAGLRPGEVRRILWALGVPEVAQPVALQGDLLV